MSLSSQQTEHYHLLEQLAEVVIVEGEGSDQEGVQDDAAGPHVGPGPVILLTLQHPEGEMRKLRKLLHWKVFYITTTGTEAQYTREAIIVISR